MNEEPKKIEEEVKENEQTINIDEEPKSENIRKNKKTLIFCLFISAIIIALVIELCIIIIDISKAKKRTYTDADFIQAMKPIIYLYPEEETSLTVKLGNPEKLTCTYPKYKETGWNVTAYPDGTLKDNETGRSLYSLYWEGINTDNIRFNDGFCVKGEDTIKFLEEKLSILGLNEREAEEFIVYWLPKMEDNSYNLIRFASMEEIEENMPLEFSLQPDTVIRILMEYKAVNKFIEVPEQKLETPKREGFVAVEWGGTEVK